MVASARHGRVRKGDATRTPSLSAWGARKASNGNVGTEARDTNEVRKTPILVREARKRKSKEARGKKGSSEARVLSEDRERHGIWHARARGWS